MEDAEISALYKGMRDLKEHEVLLIVSSDIGSRHIPERNTRGLLLEWATANTMPDNLRNTKKHRSASFR